MSRRILNKILTYTSVALMFVGGCSINDELGNIQLTGVAMLFAGLAGILFISKGGLFNERKN